MIRRMIANGLFYSRIKMIAPLMMALLLYACNKDMEHTLKADYGESGTAYKTGKVLMILVDGASGKAVQEAINTNKARHIKELVNNGMYTFEGLADSRTDLPSFSNDRGWANLLTSVTTHGVGKENETVESLQTPSFLSLLKSANDTLKTTLLSANPTFVAAFGKDVDKKETLATDGAVKDALVGILSDPTAEPSDVLLAHFQGVNSSGKATGFYNQAGEPQPNIIAAINTVDDQIGEIMNALKNRPAFATENWLVVVTSNYGGTYAHTANQSGTFYTDLERNTFTLLYSPRLNSSLFQPPASDQLKYSFYSPWYSGTGGTASAVVKDPTLFDMGARSTDTKSYTIQFMIYDTFTSAGDGHSILSKRPRINGGSGWNIRMSASGGNVAVRLEGASGSPGDNWYQIRKGNPWRVYTYVYKECGAKDSLICYLDGVEYKRALLNNNEMSNPSPLTIGKIEGANTGKNGHFYVNNLQFYDIALTPKYLATNYCKTRLDEIADFEYRDHLLGYWPNDREEDMGGNILPDYSKYGSVYHGENAGKSDMVLTTSSWEAGRMADPNVCPAPDQSFYRAVFNTVDIPYQISTWLGVRIDKGWKWEGMGWPLKYRTLEN